MVGRAIAERVVLDPVGRALAGRLLLLVGAPAGLGPRGPGGRRAGPHRVGRHPAAARLVGEALELVGGAVDRLQMALVLGLLAGRCDVGMPALGHPPAGELDLARVERRLELQEEQGLLDIEDRGHDP